MTLQDTIPADPNDPAWIEARRSFIGASDAPAVLGISPWSTPLDVWASKLNIGDQFAGNLATDMGHALEELIAQRWAKEHPGREISNPRLTIRHPHHPHIAASVDREVESDPDAGHLLECKYVGPTTAWQWKAGVPVYVQAQCQVQMAVTGAQRVHVAALIVDYAPEFRSWTIERDDASIDEIIGRLNQFWDEYVATEQRPDLDMRWDADRVKEQLERMYRPPVETNAVRLPSELVDTVQDIRRTKALIRDLEKQCKAMENDVRVWMVDNEATDAFIDDNTKPAVTWRVIQRKGYEVAPCEYQQLKVS